jgi:heme-degrading monooxygenase HmoA
MICVMNCVTVDADRADDFEQAFLDRERLLHDAEGFRGFQFLRRDKDSEYIVLTHWETEQNFRDWVKSDLFKRSHRRDGQRNFGGHSEVRSYEVLDIETPPLAETPPATV